MGQIQIKKKLLGFTGAIIASIIATVIYVEFIGPWWHPPERRISYSLTVQKMRDGKPYQEPFQSSGQEIFENDYRFKINLLSRDNGYLYLFNEGKAKDGKVYFNILYPTPLRNTGSAEIISGQQVETGENTFGGIPDTEKIWLIWTKDIKPELEASKAAAFEGNGKITAGQEEPLRAFLQNYSVNKPQALKDGTNKHTTLIGTGDVVVYLLYLEHR